MGLKESPKPNMAWLCPQLLPDPVLLSLCNVLPYFLEGGNSVLRGAFANAVCPSVQNTRLTSSPPPSLPSAPRSFCLHLSLFLGPQTEMYHTPHVRFSHPCLNLSIILPTNTFKNSPNDFFNTSLFCSTINYTKARKMLVLFTAGSPSPHPELST